MISTTLRLSRFELLLVRDECPELLVVVIPAWARVTRWRLQPGPTPRTKGRLRLVCLATAATRKFYLPKVVLPRLLGPVLLSSAPCLALCPLRPSCLLLLGFLTSLLQDMLESALVASLQPDQVQDVVVLVVAVILNQALRDGGQQLVVLQLDF